MRLTKAQRKALEWFSKRAFASMFGAGDPTLTTARKLMHQGFIETAGRDGGAFGCTRWRITDLGRAALAEETKPK